MMNYLIHFNPEDDQITMYHSHFNSLHSTQIYLRDNLVELLRQDSEILISTSEQTQGVGRRGSQWDSYENNIAMSFTLLPHQTPTLTPIEIGILCCDFLKNEFNVSLKLKWPNDLLTASEKKCGGLIAQYVDSRTIVAGIGLNLGALPKNQSTPERYKHGLGAVNESLQLSLNDKKEIPAKLYRYVLDNRINSIEDIQHKFRNNCLHIGRMVRVEDEGECVTGLFIGIGKSGEALLDLNGSTKAFIASSLKILN